MSTLPIDPVENLTKLIQCASVTPADAGALQTLENMLAPMDFTPRRITFSDDHTPDIENLYAKRSGDGPHLMFAGHTDVVPVGNEGDWSHAPFSAAIYDGVLFGRGAVDMKGGIACFIAALARVLKKRTLPGSVSLLITGDEEGPAINGSVKLLEWAKQHGEHWDGCILGEPTNPNEMGDMIKIGRRGSLSGQLIVTGVQGHAAYPHLADNPVRGMVALSQALLFPALDEGTENFEPSNLEITSIDVGNPATNVIPQEARATFNIRFNDTWDENSLKAELTRRLNEAANANDLRPHAKGAVNYQVVWKEPVSQVFLTRDDALIDTLQSAVRSVTGRTPVLATGGGTSDARFIKNYCPVVEFGLVGKTMHMVDERVALDDLETLTQVYQRFITDWFDKAQGA
ncbi:MAG: succinyl-diaminopimelate desuccinylase [Pseudomonadota bacterium]